MALRHFDSPHPLNPLQGFMTTREAATYLRMSYWHFMHLVEADRIPGFRIVDRWLFSQNDLDTYRRSTKAGAIQDLAETALNTPNVPLTPRQRIICEAILEGMRPAEIARQHQQTRQAIHAQLALIREKLDHLAMQGPLHLQPLSKQSGSAMRYTSVPLVD